jgi:hypothetical protein
MKVDASGEIKASFPWGFDCCLQEKLRVLPQKICLASLELVSFLARYQAGLGQSFRRLRR